MVQPGANPMKKITYTLTLAEQTALVKAAQINLELCQASYSRNPERYGNQPVNGLQSVWLETSKLKAIFAQLESDGIATVRKERDEFYTFADHAGDVFDPEVNDDIDPEELQTQCRRERARFNRAGTWFHSLNVLGNELDSMGGFVGNDFNGSGYDIDFYASALQQVQNALPEYHDELVAALSSI